MLPHKTFYFIKSFLFNEGAVKHLMTFKNIPNHWKPCVRKLRAMFLRFETEEDFNWRILNCKLNKNRSKVLELLKVTLVFGTIKVFSSKISTSY